MARIRTIKPEFWTDDKIIGLPYSARLFFIGLWNFSDDSGCLQDKPEQLKLLVLPGEENFDVFQVLDLLISADLIERFLDEETDSTFLVVKNWSIHQKVDNPSKSRILKSNAKKLSIPAWVRRKVAEKYGCIPGKTKQCECYFCGLKGSVYWPTKRNGEPSSWVSFSHELSHIISEFKEGATDDTNIVLACRNCNRSMGTKNAFDWLFDSRYHTNQFSPNVEIFRESSRAFESLRGGKEGNGKEGNGKEGNNASPPLVIEYPFSELFKNIWLQWKNYKKKEHNFNYKSPQSEQSSLQDLVKKSDGVEETAVAIIQQSMANGWKGFFELKISGNGRKSTDAVASTSISFSKIDLLHPKIGS